MTRKSSSIPKRRKVISTTLDEREVIILDAVAFRAGTSRSRFIHDCVQSCLETYADDPDIQRIIELKGWKK